MPAAPTDGSDPASAASAPGWQGAVAGRVANLAGARVVAQCIGLAWFLYAARELGPVAFGILSTGLALVWVIGGFSDLGTTRTVVRHVAADPTCLRANFRRAGAIRLAGGAVIGLITVGVLGVVAPGVPESVVALAAVVAMASGLTEVGFAALRATGRVGTEVTLLVLERALFVVGGVAVVARGGGPVAVLTVYAATNLVSAVVVTVQAHRFGRHETTPSGPFFDAEGRSTALGSTLVIIGPRVSVVILVVLASPTVLGAFTIAQKVPEAMGILGTAAILPVLPLLRSSVAGAGWRAARDRGALITAAVAGAMTPVVAWLAIDGRRVLELLFDAGERRGIVAALAFLAGAALLWVFRTLGETVLLAEERAGLYLRALGAGLVVNVILGIGLVDRWGAAGAAGAALAGEVVVLIWVVVVQHHAAVFTRPAVTVLLAALVGVPVAVLARSLPVLAAGALVGLVALAVLAVSARSLVGARSGAPGDDADVGQEIGGDLLGDGVETVEHGSGPAQHL